MIIVKCDRCGAEIAKEAQKYRVEIIANRDANSDGYVEEIINDLCDHCRMQLREFFRPTEPVPTLFNTDKARKEAEEDFWATHDPSGGDLPPEDDEKSVGGGMKWIHEKTKAPARQQGEKQKRAAKVDHGKICALRKAGWSVKEICAEMHISPATVFNHLKMEKGNEEEQGM